MMIIVNEWDHVNEPTVDARLGVQQVQANETTLEFHELRRNLSHIIMPRLLRMTTSLTLTIHNHPTHTTLDSHAPRISEIMLRLQLFAQLRRVDQNLLVVLIPHPLVEIRGQSGFGMWWVGGGLHDGVVVDAWVDEDAARGGAFVEFVYSEGLGWLVGAFM
jgi:hypothetical protein